MAKTVTTTPPRLAAEQREGLVRLFVDDLRAKADATDDPHCILWLALYAGAAITGDLGDFDLRGVRSRRWTGGMRRAAKWA